jgi:hypothetical protein
MPSEFCFARLSKRLGFAEFCAPVGLEMPQVEGLAQSPMEQYLLLRE